MDPWVVRGPRGRSITRTRAQEGEWARNTSPAPYNTYTIYTFELLAEDVNHDGSGRMIYLFFFACLFLLLSEDTNSAFKETWVHM